MPLSFLDLNFEIPIECAFFGQKSSFWVIFSNTIHKLAQIQLNPNHLLVSNLHLVAINLYMIWSIFKQGPEADH